METASVRPFDPLRDLVPVTELIVVAFGDRLGPSGQAALAEMQRLARWGSFLGRLSSPAWSDPGGFVWVEEGCVVGNVSLRRAPGTEGYLIGNVAVHPDWQGRGFASALMQTALRDIRARGGRWVGLEVWAENRAAIQVYEKLGFREIGRTLRLLRPTSLPLEGGGVGEAALWQGREPGSVSPPTCAGIGLGQGSLVLRRGRSGDHAALAGLLRAVVPRSQRALLEIRERDYRPGWERALDCWIEGRREHWWVIEEGGGISAAVRALRERGRRPDVLEVLVAPGQSGRFEDVLVRQGLACLGGARARMVEAVLVLPAEPLKDALRAAGFQDLRLYAQMRLDVA
jgi:ribosomal protein S18 acetylase RimI-like enzyme